MTTMARARPASLPTARITLAYNSEPTSLGGPGNDTNTTLDFGFFANTPPVITNVNNSTFTEDGPAILLDSGDAITVTDSQTHLNGGNLTVSITTNKVAGEDVLGIAASATVILSNGTNTGSTVSH